MKTHNQREHKRARNKTGERQITDVSLTKLRSALTNGSKLLVDVDHRSAWMRRLRDLISGHFSDLGGADNLSTAEASIIRRASMLELQMEMLESRFADNDGVATTDQLLLYQRTASAARRLFESVGIKRRAKDIAPSLRDYIEQKGVEA
jgi:hypothetical protein